MVKKVIATSDPMCHICVQDTKDLDKLYGKVEGQGEDLINDADQLGSDASNIKDTLDNLGDRLKGLTSKLEDKADDLSSAGEAVGAFNEMLKGIANEVGMLDDELNNMGPIARDLDTLHKQLDEVQVSARKPHNLSTDSHAF